MKIMNWSIQEN